MLCMQQYLTWCNQELRVNDRCHYEYNPRLNYTQAAHELLVQSLQARRGRTQSVPAVKGTTGMLLLHPDVQLLTKVQAIGAGPAYNPAAAAMACCQLHSCSAAENAPHQRQRLPPPQLRLHFHPAAAAAAALQQHWRAVAALLLCCVAAAALQQLAGWGWHCVACGCCCCCGWCLRLPLAHLLQLIRGCVVGCLLLARAQVLSCGC